MSFQNHRSGQSGGHGPEQEQFWKYMKDNKVLETLQPALTLLHQLPVKPYDLYSFFADFLENGAKSSIQRSLLQAELCFKHNELEEARSFRQAGGQFPYSDTKSSSPKNIADYKHQQQNNYDESSDTDLNPFGSQSSLHSIFPTHEMDAVMSYIEEYHELDPFGILFDFRVHDNEIYETLTKYEQPNMTQDALSNNRLKSKSKDMNKSVEFGIFRPFSFDVKPVHSIEKFDARPVEESSPMEKLVTGLKKFQQIKKQTATDASYGNTMHNFDLNEFKMYDAETSLNDVRNDIDWRRSVKSLRKKLLHDFDVRFNEKKLSMDDQKKRKHRKKVLRKMKNKYLNELSEEYQLQMEKNLTDEIGITKDDKRREKLQRALRIPNDDIEKEILSASYHGTPSSDDVANKDSFVKHFPESVWRITESTDLNSPEYDDEDDNYIWLRDIKASCKIP